MTIKAVATYSDLLNFAGKWMTVNEIAKELSVHPDTIRRWEKKGRIKCVRHPVNNYRLFLIQNLEGK